MKYANYGYIQASQLSIGTSFWGSRIGARRAHYILDTLHAIGVNTIDTASSYGLGQSESIIGDCLRGRREQFFVSTKVGMHHTQVPLHKRLLLPLARPLYKHNLVKGRLSSASSTFMSQEEMLSCDAFEASIYRSLKRLKTDYLDQIIIHCNVHQYLNQDAYFEILLALRDKKIVRHIGISLVDEGDVMNIESIDHFSEIDTIQVPYVQYPILIQNDECKYVNYFSLFSPSTYVKMKSLDEAIQEHVRGHFIVAMSSDASIQKNIQLFRSVQ